MVPGIGHGERSSHKQLAITWVRLVAAAAGASVILSSSSSSPSARLTAYAVTLYAGSRLLIGKPRKGLLVLDAIVASLVIAITGTVSSPMLAFGLSVTVAAGLEDLPLGTICGILVISESIPWLAQQAGLGITAVNRVGTWAAIFPISGVTAGLANRVWGSTERGRAQVERKRIARDLHDGVAQTLAHLRMELDMLSHVHAERDPDEMARLARVAERTLSDVRGIIRDLAAPAPAGGVARALAAYVGDVSTQHGPEIVLSVIGEIPAEHPSGADLFRIAQEAISNSVRHAHATRVSVMLERCAGGAIRLRVSDNGNGLANSTRQGLGLGAMRERAAAIGADYAFASEPDKGTVIEVITPPALMRIA
ncbi:MAG: sensor histidine kinase [Actinomycetota bacterium]